MREPGGIDPLTSVAVVVRQFSTAGGLELYAHKVVEGLLAHGLHVTVICEKNESALTAEHLRVIPFGVCPSKSKTALFKHLFEGASKALAEHGPFDIVHSQHCPVAGATVATFHNHTTKRLSEVGMPVERILNEAKRHLTGAYQLRHRQDEILCQDSSCLIFPAEVMAQDYYATFDFLTSQSKPYVVAHPGADLAGADPDNCSTVPSVCDGSSGDGHEAHRFLFVGRGFRKKGLDVLLEACRVLKGRGRKFTLCIAGLKAKNLDLLRLRYTGLSNCVRYLGFCDDMESVYRQSDFIVLPSRVEPFGMAPVQAMKRGLVPIVSRVSGVAEVLTHEHNALILQDHCSAEELASLMERLCCDASLRDRLAGNARHTARQVSWDVTVRQTLLAYQIALQSRTGGLTESNRPLLHAKR